MLDTRWRWRAVCVKCHEYYIKDVFHHEATDINRTVQYSDDVVHGPGLVFPGLVIVQAGFVTEALLTHVTGVEERGVKVFGLHVIPDTGSSDVVEAETERAEIFPLNLIFPHILQQLAGVR